MKIIIFKNKLWSIAIAVMCWMFSSSILAEGYMDINFSVETDQRQRNGIYEISVELNNQSDAEINITLTLPPTLTQSSRYTLTPTSQQGGIPHLVAGELFNSDHSIPADEDISFITFITLRPTDILNQSSGGCEYAGGYWQINTGNFNAGWSAGEELEVNFQNLANGESGILCYELTTDDPDIVPDFYLNPTITPPPSPSATPTPLPSATPTITPHPSPSATPTPLPSATPSVTPLPTPEYLVLAAGDYDGDGTSDIAIFRPNSGLWAVRGLDRVYFGTSGDIPVSGDYDGDGIADVSIFRPSSGLWAVKQLTRLYFGGSDDIPVPSDYDGDGISDIGIFRSSSGLWAVRDIARCYFGGEGDLPVPGDYDGEGISDIGIFRSSSGLWAVQDLTRVYYGAAGDTPVPGMYQRYGSNKTTGPFRTQPAIFRPASGLWAVQGLTRVYFGASGDTPAVGDFDGSLLDNIAIFRPSGGLWAIRGITRAYFGTPGDIPVTR